MMSRRRIRSRIRRPSPRGRLVHLQPVDEAIAGVVQDEQSGHQKEPANDDVEAGLGDGDLLSRPIDVQREPPRPR